MEVFEASNDNWEHIKETVLQDYIINSLILTNIYGGYGLAYSLLLTEIFSFLIHYFLINRK